MSNSPGDTATTGNRGPFKSKKRVAERYNTTSRTVDRWSADPELGFPERLVINGRIFYSEPELIEFDRRRAAETMMTRPVLRGIARQLRGSGSDPPA